MHGLLARALDGTGPALLPIPDGTPDLRAEALLAAMRPSSLRTPDGTTDLPGGVAVGPDAALVVTTSGSTGEPKGVMHTHNTLVAANAPLPDRLGVSKDDVIHMASTFAHLTGFLYGVRLPVQVGGATAVYQDVWDPARFVDLIEEHRITYTSAATPFLADTLGRPDP